MPVWLPHFPSLKLASSRVAALVWRALCWLVIDSIKSQVVLVGPREHHLLCWGTKWKHFSCNNRQPAEQSAASLSGGDLGHDKDECKFDCATIVRIVFPFGCFPFEAFPLFVETQTTSSAHCFCLDPKGALNSRGLARCWPAENNAS